ncbi:hypothetical protein PYW07_007706 [Mythimna separata]|uniref:Lipocalin/cytosolic fatty-acid binding domain-containing protein n=1 Tax=Mythimna separata TaxID=271217 RepID=A0AAD7YRC1_MYTSE|nr:hypothetical protein PYW07_007706 [Mythimna separata]
MCYGQVLQFGPCVEVKTMQYFDLEEFLGQWYEIERFPIWYEQSGDCAYKRIQHCGRRVEIEHVYVRDGIQFILHLNTTFAPGDEAVFVIPESNIDPVGIPLTVLTTDYRNYAIVYGCKTSDTLGLKYITAWIMSRQPTLPEEFLQKAYHEINSLPSVSSIYLEKVDQSAARCQAHWTAHVQAVNYTNDDQK